jgi:hypothetical protein
VSDANRPQHASTAAAKKPYTPPTLTECGSVAKLTMAKGTTLSELSQIVKKQCL